MRPYGWTNKLVSANRQHRARAIARRTEIGHKSGGELWRRVGTLNGAHLATGDLSITYVGDGLARVLEWADKHQLAYFWVEDELVESPLVGSQTRGARGTTAATHADGTPVYLEGLK